MWFYKIERDEKNKYINITWNTTMTYIKSILGVVGVGACLFNLVWLAAICLTILAVALTYYLYRYGNLVRILHSHEQKKGLEYTGSQYSDVYKRQVQESSKEQKVRSHSYQS